MERVLFVVATAGEETTATGAAISRLRSAGSDVTVVTGVTDPEAATELTEALRALDVRDHRYLGAPGARWEGLEPRQYSASAEATASLVAADLGEVASDVGAVIMAVSPDVVVSFGTAGATAEQRRVHDAAAWATEVLRVPFYTVGRPGGRGEGRVDDAASLARRRSALAAYRGRVALAAPDAAEVFTRERPAAAPFARAGLLSRVVSSVLAVVLGVFAGALLTVIHQASALIGEVPVPWGLIVALVLTAALLAGLRIVYETRIVPGVATAGFLGAQAVLAFASPGGSVIVPDNTAGVVWTIGSVLIAAVVLAWPRVGGVGGGRMKTPAVKGPEHP